MAHRASSGPYRAVLVLLMLAVLTLLAAGCGTVAEPQGWAAPTVRDDVVVTSHDAGKLGAYRLTSAALLWEFPTKQAKLDLNGIYGNPVLSDDTVYVSGYNGSVVAVAAAEGSERWRQKLGSRVIGGVLVTPDTVYAGTDAGDLVALDRATGAERWRRNAGNQVWSAPVSDGATVFVAAMDGRVTAFHPDGSRRWQTRVADAAIAGTPALRDGVLYLGSYDKHLYAVDAASGEPRWRSSEAALNWFWTEPVIDGDNLFAGNLDGHVYAVDRRTGALRWRTDLAAPVRARAAVADGVLLVPAKDGRLWGLRPESGAQAWQPVAVGGRLYADLTVARPGIFLAAEVGKKSHRLYEVNAVQGAVREIALSN